MLINRMLSLPRRQWILLVVAVIGLLCLLVYARALGADFVSWDDGILIYENKLIRTISLHSLAKTFSSYDPELYIPLTLVSYQIDYAVVGLQPFVYHLHNLLLHIGSALLVAWMGTIILRHRLDGAVIGLLFALHPLNTEAVAWVSARKDVLSAFFFFGSVVSYLYYQRRALEYWNTASRTGDLPDPASPAGRRQTGAASPLRVSENAGRPFYWLSLGLFLLGLLAKVSVIMLPLVLLLLDRLRGRRMNRAAWAEKIPYVALAIVFVIVAVIGKWGSPALLNPWQTLLLACRSAVFYLQAFILPIHLSPIELYVPPIRLLSPDILLSIAVLCLAAAIVIRVRRRMPLVAFGCAFFLITLIPSFVTYAKAGELYLASDRYAYVPMVGLLLAGAGLARRWIGTAADATARPHHVLAAVLLVLMAASYALGAHAQSLHWMTSEDLYRGVIVAYPQSHIAHNSLGVALWKRRAYAAAEEEFRRSLAIKPANAMTHRNLGAIFAEQGRLSEAVSEYRRALAIDPENADALFGIGITYAATNRLDDAQRMFVRALTIRPQSAEILNSLGTVYSRRGLILREIDLYKRAIEADADFPLSYYNLAATKRAQRLPHEAIGLYQTAIRLEPAFLEAHIELATVALELNMLSLARTEAEAAWQLKPDRPDVQRLLKLTKGLSSATIHL